MPVKTFRAKSLNQALIAVKNEFGPDAVILHTKIHKVGGLLGIGAQTVHEITATAPAPTKTTKKQSSNENEDHNQRRRRLLELAKQHAAASRRQAIASTLEQADPLQDSPTPAYRRPSPQPSHRAQQSQPASPAPREVPQPEPQAIDTRITERIDDLSRMVSQMLNTHRSPEASGIPEHLGRVLMTLTENGVPATTAREILDDVRRTTESSDMPDTQLIDAALVASIAKRIPCQHGIPKPQRQADSRPLTIAFVGPTGVGKTTTIAKLAATYKLRFGAKVALLTCDTFRIAAVDQLRTYANIIGVPVRVAVTPSELKAAAEDLADQADVIFVDTAGRSHTDADKVGELTAGLAELDPHQTHLVLNASAATNVLERAAGRFAQASPTHLTLTKLDEAVTTGSLFSILNELERRACAVSLAYVTTGQQVPEQIDLAVSERIAARIAANPFEDSASTQCAAITPAAQDTPPAPLQIAQQVQESPIGQHRAATPA